MLNLLKITNLELSGSLIISSYSNPTMEDSADIRDWKVHMICGSQLRIKNAWVEITQ